MLPSDTLKGAEWGGGGVSAPPDSVSVKSLTLGHGGPDTHKQAPAGARAALGRRNCHLNTCFRKSRQLKRTPGSAFPLEVCK